MEGTLFALVFGLMIPGAALAEEALSFTLMTLDREIFDAEDLRGKPLVISVMATWCHACRQETPELRKACIA
jgi:thiol-disulfide isomerase/thioredoxin